MSPLQIRLFGNLQLVRDGSHLPSLATERARALLAFLVLHRGRMLPRDALVSILWPGHPQASARRKLQSSARRVSHLLQAWLGSEASCLHVSANELGFHPGEQFRVDVAEFEHCVHTAGARPGSNPSPGQADLLRRAVEVYRGDLLEGIADEWCAGERKRLRLMYASALDTLIRYHRERQECAEAITFGQRLLAIDPMQERVHRDLMRCYLQRGDIASAVRQLTLCEQLIGCELSREPASEVRALRDRSTSPCAAAAEPGPAYGALRLIPGPVPPLLDEVESILATLLRRS